MKKVILCSFILIATLSKAQEKEEKYPQDVDKKYEAKINVTNLLFFEWFDVSYEYLIDEESSFGASALINLDGNDTWIFDDSRRKFSLTTYYRRYFSRKYARGFFVEGFGMLHSHKIRDYYYDYNYDYGTSNSGYNYSDETGFSLGISIGGKFVTKSGFTTEIYLGIGRNLGGDDSFEVVSRGGVSLGYRF